MTQVPSIIGYLGNNFLDVPTHYNYCNNTRGRFIKRAKKRQAYKALLKARKRWCLKPIYKYRSLLARLYYDHST